jgi:osmotically-inducible protein OsmY
VTFLVLEGTVKRVPKERQEVPEAGVGGEGLIADQTVLAPQTDAELEQAIRTAFFLEPDLPSDPFSVLVEGGVAYIGGPVDDAAMRRRALAVAAGVQRVLRVIPAFG